MFSVKHIHLLCEMLVNPYHVSYGHENALSYIGNQLTRFE